MTSLLPANDPRVPGFRPTPFALAMEHMPTLWARLTVGLRNGAPALQSAVDLAERYLADKALIGEIEVRGWIAAAGEIDEFLRLLVSAWPNPSQADLAGYGMQLRVDVAEYRPSTYALDEASRHLRRTSTFLPSISEVIAAIANADKRMAAVVRTIDLIPSALAEARALLKASPAR